MTVDDDIEAIRERQLEIATRSLTAAIDGELDSRNTSWMPYLEDKAEAAGRAAATLADLAATARELPAP